MGTRGLLGLIIQGQRHGAYNHFDSYPSGLGVEIVKVLLSLQPSEYAFMIARVKEITWVQESSPPSTELQEKYSALGFSDTGVATQGLDNWYCLLRKVQGAAALPAIKEGKLGHLVESVEFLKDGLFCEWAYFIDFEKQTLETFKSGKSFDAITFDKLREVGEEYMEGLKKMYEKRENGEGSEVDDTAVANGV